MPRCQTYSPLLTAEEEKELAKRVHLGDRSARDELARRNEPLVLHLVKKLVPSAILSRHHDDLVSAGTMGLLEAANRYAPEDHSDVRFASFAAYWVRMEIFSYLRHCRIVWVPIYLARDARPCQRTSTARRRAEIRRAMTRATSAIHYFNVHGSDDDSPDRVPEPVDPRSLASQTSDDREAIDRAMAILTERERDVITLRYGLGDRAPMGTCEVAAALGLTRTWIYELHRRALSKLRWSMTAPAVA